MTEIAPQTHMGAVELSVSDLERSLEYWQRVVGLRVLARENGGASLGTDRELVRFVEEPGARPAAGSRAYTTSRFSCPTGRASHAGSRTPRATQSRIEGLSDHDVSEAIYLRDPDRHGIEIYADRPRELWEGQVMQRMTTVPLDVESLLAELDDPASEPFDGLPDGTTVGHVHLRVADVDATIAFYRDVLGFDLMAQLGPMAAFLSAGGYHHHVGGEHVGDPRCGPRRRPAPRGCATRRSCCPTRRSGTRGRARGRRGTGAAGPDGGCSFTTPRRTHFC